ncbi:unnamed protein product [Haemonchus placei]|uniref:AraC family transcriptional regulator n=1 Tax=Haemonchus placei TaxID=6290 RepID=A0A0N4VWW3_HAEPC|nr:unnamed protein product [Haemonchus placei]
MVVSSPAWQIVEHLLVGEHTVLLETPRLVHLESSEVSLVWNRGMCAQRGHRLEWHEHPPG